MEVLRKKNGKSQSQDQLVAGPWAGRSFSPVPGQLKPPLNISLCKQEGVERFISSSLQCQLGPVLSWLLVPDSFLVKGAQNYLYLKKKLYPQLISSFLVSARILIAWILVFISWVSSGSLLVHTLGSEKSPPVWFLLFPTFLFYSSNIPTSSSHSTLGGRCDKVSIAQNHHHHSCVEYSAHKTCFENAAN